MTDIILVLGVAAVFAFGFFVMSKLGPFIYKNRKIVEREDDRRDSDDIMISSKLSDDEILEKVHKFQKDDK